MMPLGIWVVVGWMILVSLTGVIFLIWRSQSRRFKDVEEAKYHMREVKQPALWPERERD